MGWTGLRGRATPNLSALAGLHFGVLAFAMVALITAFVVSDFSLAVVFSNSHTAKPLFYRIAGAWGNHEGSMLMWALMSGGYLCWFASVAQGLPERLYRMTLGFGGLATAGVNLFVATVSSPFTTLPKPYPLDGNGLNPLLQDIGLVIHPPVLYLGYVGLLIPWALALGALATRTEAGVWARAVKPWAYLSLAFLTAGIMLGSWWAYRELGWGGWWFWDPVENVSVLPWLLAVALAHSAVTAGKRGTLVGWSVALAILAYGSALLGTFLVRSGTLVSVHAFAADPARGIAILVYLSALIGGGLVLLALRLPASRRLQTDLISRDTAMSLQNVLIVAMTATILLGTVYPPLLQALGQPPIAVGAPYYAISVVPIMIGTLVLMAVATSVNWRGGVPKPQRWRFVIGAVVSVVGGAIALALGRDPVTVAAVAAAILLLAMQARRMPPTDSARRSSLATQVSHAGVGVFALAATLSHAFAIESDRDVRVGDTLIAGSYELTLAAVEEVQGANFVGARGIVDIAGRGMHRLLPEYRLYPVRDIPTTEADIHSNLLRDLRVSLNLVETRDDGTPVWALRFHRRPAMVWLWLGTLMTFIGLLLSARNALREL